MRAIKALVIGEPGVGKKTLEFFVCTGQKRENHYCYSQESRINVENTNITLVDIQGGKDYTKVRERDYNTSEVHVIIATFSLANLNTLAAIKETYLPEIKHALGYVPPIVLVGTHADEAMHLNDPDNQEIIERLKKDLKTPYFEMSISDDQVILDKPQLLEQVRIQSLKNELQNISQEAERESKTNKVPVIGPFFKDVSSKIRLATTLKIVINDTYNNLGELQQRVQNRLTGMNNNFYAEKALDIVQKYGEIKTIPASQSIKSARMVS